MVFQSCHRSKLPESGVWVHHHEHYVQAGEFGCQFTEDSTTHSSDLKVDETGALFGLAAVTVKNVSPSDYPLECEAERKYRWRIIVVLDSGSVGQAKCQLPQVTLIFIV